MHHYDHTYSITTVIHSQHSYSPFHVHWFTTQRHQYSSLLISSSQLFNVFYYGALWIISRECNDNLKLQPTLLLCHYAMECSLHPTSLPNPPFWQQRYVYYVSLASQRMFYELWRLRVWIPQWIILNANYLHLTPNNAHLATVARAVKCMGEHLVC